MGIEWPFAAFLLALAVFHLSEALLDAVFHPEDFGFRSLLVTRPYALAMGCAVAEYLVEIRLWPALKSGALLPGLGLALIVGGEALRKTAILTAKSNFTQTLAETGLPRHRLVSHGVYAIARHPAYLGWWAWCAGTQLLLANPVCLPVFAYLAWRFIVDRVRDEERSLASFFPREYPLYRARVPAWIPFL